MELLADVNRRDGVAVLAVLHDLALAAHFFPRLALLDGGRIVADGPPAHVLAPERIRATFGVDPAIFAGSAAFAEPAILAVPGGVRAVPSELTAGPGGR
jgi:iron complex transport system ATP-binding protein